MAASIGVLLGLASGLLAAAHAPSPWESSPRPPIGLEEATRALAEAFADADALGRARATAGILHALGGAPGSAGVDSIAALREVFEPAPLSDGDVEFALLAAWWSRSDPEGAYRWTLSAPQAGSISVLVAVFEGWGRSDAHSALQAAQREALEIRRIHALAAALTGAFSTPSGRKGFAAAAAEIAERAERRESVRIMATQQLGPELGQGQGNALGEQQAPALIAWAEALRTPDLTAKQDVVAGVAMAALHAARDQAIESLASFDRERGELPPDVVAQVAAIWGEQEPAAALGWLASLDAGEARTLAVRSTYERWLGRDRDAALAWAAERADHPEAWFDPIRAAYAFILGTEDPAEGLRLLLALPLGRERTFKVADTLARWKALEPEAAERWLQQADLPEARKQELRRLPPARPLGVGHRGGEA